MENVQSPNTSNIKSLLSPISPKENKSKIPLSENAKNGYGHACTIISCIQKWYEVQKKGLLICSSIKDLRLYELIDKNGYSAHLTNLCESLNDIIISLDNIIEIMQITLKQSIALSKLDGKSEPLFNTWSSGRLSTEISELVDMFIKESNNKRNIKENIMHCCDENLMEIYYSAWEYNIFLHTLKIELFLTESTLNDV